MAYDRTEPRTKLIAIVGGIAVVSLVGIKFALDSYFITVNEAVAAEKDKMPEVYEPLQKLHEGEQKSLTQTGLPIGVAMAEIAKSRPADLTPQPSEDLGPMTGWSKLPKKPLAVPSGSEIQSCKDAAGKEARLLLEKDLQKHGGSLSFNDLDFVPGTDRIDTTKPSSVETMKELVAFSQGCAELTFDITGHTSKEGAADKNLKLSEQRAIAVKKALIAAGVRETAVGATTGAGSTKPAMAEPDADSEEAKKIGPARLELIRNVNRRITITVTKHCP